MNLDIKLYKGNSITKVIYETGYGTYMQRLKLKLRRLRDCFSSAWASQIF